MLYVHGIYNEYGYRCLRLVRKTKDELMKKIVRIGMMRKEDWLIKKSTNTAQGVNVIATDEKDASL